MDDLRAFVTVDTAGEVGVALGALLRDQTKIGAKEVYAVAIGAAAQPGQVVIEPSEVHFSFDRNFAVAVAGRAEADRRHAVLVGAGALGSQVAIDLAREGALSWTVVDQDSLMPHNLARHALLASDIGAPKAIALARQMSALLDETFTAIRCDVTNPGADVAAQLAGGFSAADIIIDASASVAVSRHLADLPGVKARRLCTFLNPAGTAAVLLAESTDRRITLRDLEAQYHGLILSDPALAEHLRTNKTGLRYSGSCRELTNLIPSTHAALLSALAARGISECLGSDQSAICIWTLSERGEVRLVRRAGAAVTTTTIASWSVTCDENVLRTLGEYRERCLPRETGGILLGIIDVSRRSIHVAHALPQPEDSLGGVAEFERGVVGLSDAINRVVESSLHQVRYIGEWHSHPRGASALPSRIDLAQLAWLGDELDAEGVPALMAIAADDGAFSFMICDNARNKRTENAHRRSKFA
jgi:hypothetical protein